MVGAVMRRESLSPPRAARMEPVVPEVVRPGKERRHHGLLRRVERRVSYQFSSKLLFRIPGIHRLYDRALRRSLTLSECEIVLPGLAGSFEGLRLLLITDVHAGPFVGTRVLRETFERLLECRPDAVLLGGDLTGGTARQFTRHREAFAALRAPLGVFAVLGNHDYYEDRPGPLRGMLEACGIGLLTNRWVRLERAGAELALAGVDDLHKGRPDLDAALAGAPSPVVLLSHNPDLLFEAARRGVALMLSGHTHGGQVCVPGLPLMLRQSRYRLDGGRYRARGTELVVSRGLGAVGLPVRIGCPPEAVLLTLK